MNSKPSHQEGGHVIAVDALPTTWVLKLMIRRSRFQRASYKFVDRCKYDQGSSHLNVIRVHAGVQIVLIH